MVDDAVVFLVVTFFQVLPLRIWMIVLDPLGACTLTEIRELLSALTARDLLASETEAATRAASAAAACLAATRAASAAAAWAAATRAASAAAAWAAATRAASTLAASLARAATCARVFPTGRTAAAFTSP